MKLCCLLYEGFFIYFFIVIFLLTGLFSVDLPIFCSFLFCVFFVFFFWFPVCYRMMVIEICLYDADTMLGSQCWICNMGNQFCGGYLCFFSWSLVFLVFLWYNVCIKSK